MIRSSEIAGSGDIARSIQSMLSRILMALARTLIRHNVGFPTFMEIAKVAFIQVAASEYGLRSRPTSKSRIALLTGINRREVAKVQARSTQDLTGDLYNPVFRVVSHWINAPELKAADGRPVELSLDGGSQSLQEITRQCCPDVPMTAVLRELIVSGVAEYADEDAMSLRLILAGWVPRQDVSAKLELMGVDAAALLTTMAGNVADPERALFQRKVSFSDLTEEGVAWLNARAARDGQAWLETLNEELAQFRHPSSGKGQFAGMGIYVFGERRPSAVQIRNAKLSASEGESW